MTEHANGVAVGAFSPEELDRLIDGRKILDGPFTRQLPQTDLGGNLSEVTQHYAYVAAESTTQAAATTFAGFWSDDQCVRRPHRRKAPVVGLLAAQKDRCRPNPGRGFLGDQEERPTPMIAILTPSRGRPERLAEMVDSIRETAADDVAIYVGLDLDDWANYKQIDGVNYLVRSRMRLAPWTNLLAADALGHGHDIVGFFGDDHCARTQGWDLRVREAFTRMGSGLVYAADGLQDERLPTAPFWSADIVGALGWFYPPTLQHLYADDYWLALANDLGRRTYLPDVLIEHMHPSALDTEGTPKAVADALNAENDSFYEQDRDEFLRILREDHPAILERVRTGLDAH